MSFIRNKHIFCFVVVLCEVESSGGLSNNGVRMSQKKFEGGKNACFLVTSCIN